ncbi:WGxxGxxG family protein [Paenibacillus camerounensis]|uniref:WGxxGxxG family protein n=1 Tax=Paenibacillus camerounensis TaxID=1243663 RepID=UPI000694AD18|nr:WGxxGxxG family protein [Paenibacillus camerounensis]
MNKLVTSLACGTLLSMSLMGSGYAANAAGTGGGMGASIPDTGRTGMQTERIRETNGTTGTHMLNGTGNRMMNQTGNTMRGTESRMNHNGNTMMNELERSGDKMMNNATGTMRKGGNMVNNAVRGNDNSSVSPLSTSTETGRYRATSTTTSATDNNRGSNWGWLGLVGLLGLAGMRSRSGERERH